MNDQLLFVDGSADPQSKVGFGAYLFVSSFELQSEDLMEKIQVKQFDNTSSTRLELQTLLWALENITPTIPKITVYSDSQNLIHLNDRLAQLEATDFRSKNNRPLSNSEYYRSYSEIQKELDLEFVKVQGHQRANSKNAFDWVFTVVDRAARQALREHTNNLAGRMFG